MFGKTRKFIGVTVGAGAIAVALVAYSGAPAVHLAPGANLSIGGVAFRTPQLLAPLAGSVLLPPAEGAAESSPDQTGAVTHSGAGCPIALPQ